MRTLLEEFILEKEYLRRLEKANKEELASTIQRSKEEIERLERMILISGPVKTRYKGITGRIDTNFHVYGEYQGDIITAKGEDFGSAIIAFRESVEDYFHMKEK